jgi:hypothetical protein
MGIEYLSFQTLRLVGELDKNDMSSLLNTPVCEKKYQEAMLIFIVPLSIQALPRHDRHDV